MKNDLSALATALALMNLFKLWPVVLHPPGGGRNGKAPIGNAWGKTRPTEASLRETFALHPGAGVGILLGPGGVIDIEVDGPEGEESLRRLFDGETVPTMGWSSRRGPHRLFLWDARLAEIDPQHRAKLTLPQYPGLEFRFGQGRQAQSACPPTAGEEGVARRWNDCDVIAPLPECFFAHLREALATPKPGASAPRPQARAESNGTMTPTERARRCVFAMKKRAVSGENGHATLYSVARALIDGFGLPRAEALPILSDWNQQMADPPESEAQVEHKIDQALKNFPSPSLDLLNAPLERDHDRASRDGTQGGKPPDGARSGAANGRATAGSYPGPEPANPDDDDDTPLPPPRWPDPPGEEAYHGPAGDAVRLIEPHTEADPLGILGHVLVMFGSMVGRGPHMIVDGARHGVNENVVIVGETAAARKGTARARAFEVLRDIDPEWMSRRIQSGLSSGEGLIHQVRDAKWVRQPSKDEACAGEYDDLMIDEGESDKRLLIIEPEYGAVLRSLQREGNRLSALLRSAWDGDNLATMTKCPFRATEPHISVIGHITFSELRALLSGMDISNGLAGRTVWLCVRRARLLPFGGETVDLEPIRARFREAFEFSRDIKEMKFTGRARRLYAEHYPRLSSPPPGVLGEVTARATAHVIRWGMLYALADRSMEFDECHLRAALAVIDASIRAAAHIFGDALGSPDAEKILAALRAAPDGLTRAEINIGVFNRHTNAERIRAALGLLVHHNLARESQDDGTGGRPARRYFAAEHAKEAKEAHKAHPRPGDSSLPSLLSHPPRANGHPETPHPAEEREEYEL